MQPPDLDNSMSALQLGGFVAENPDFVFDVEEFLFSYKIRSILAQRMQEFLINTNPPVTGWPIKDTIVADLEAGKWSGVPAYRAYRPVGKFEDLPTVSKQDLRGFNERYLCSDLANEPLWQKHTTGSSGSPIRIWYDQTFYFDLLILALRKIIARAGEEIPRGHQVFCLSLSDNHSLPNSIFVDPTGETGISVQIVVDGSKPQSFAPIFHFIDKYRPICLSSKPSLLEIFAEIRGSASSQQLSCPVHIISSGSALLPELKERLGALTQGRVINAYAMTEFGLVASECSHGELHVDPSSLLIEVLDDAGRAAAAGELGELVLTSHLNSAMPLLRYRTGDLGAIENARCRCGSAAPRIHSLNGRKIQCFRLPSGGLFPPTCFNDMFTRFPELVEFQVTQEALSAFTVRVEFRSGWAAAGESLVRITQHFANALPERPDVTVNETRFPPDSKFQRYRSNL
jgi:phenylacetate-coenzyme A ligase PaaK-like adenylate-forming protein